MENIINDLKMIISTSKCIYSDITEYLTSLLNKGRIEDYAIMPSDSTDEINVMINIKPEGFVYIPLRTKTA